VATAGDLGESVRGGSLGWGEGTWKNYHCGCGEEGQEPRERENDQVKGKSNGKQRTSQNRKIENVMMR
jgi:hypothetical protein